MYHAENRRRALAKSIFSLWAFWAVGVGCLALLVVIAPFVTAKMVPLIAVFLYISLLAYERQRRSHGVFLCYRVPHIIQLVLLHSALLLVIVIFYTNMEGATEFTGQIANPDNPMIPALVISPLATIICANYMLRRRNAAYCRKCRQRNSDSIDHGILNGIYSRETSFQIKLLFLISLMVCISTWVYYFTCYININLNSADRYVFIIFPVSFYVLSLIYLGSRYYTMWAYYTVNADSSKLVARAGTSIRYLIINGDRMLISAPTFNPEAILPDDNKIDTPLHLEVPFRETLSEYEAQRYFDDTSGLRGDKVTISYVTRDRMLFFNVFHCIVTVTDPEATAKALGGEWATIGDIQLMISAKAVATPLLSELNRIHTVAMAWKTYDNRGFRKYKIKNYRPTFRLRDLQNWDVDFNDPTWINVSMLNQDKPLFRLRRFWNKYIKGLGI